jgi:hypothetical protein
VNFRTQVRRLLHPPRVTAITRRPAGYFAVGRNGLSDVIAWALYDDGQVVGLISDGNGGMRPAMGRHFRGYLPAAALRGAEDVQKTPPPVAFPVADLQAAIADLKNPWTQDAQLAIYTRLRAAAEAEWAAAALCSFIANPDRFLRLYFERVAEHGQAAELSDPERGWLADLINTRGGRP